MRALFSLLFTIVLSGPAKAAFPDDVHISQLDTWRDAEVNSEQAIGDAYNIVIRQLAAGIMNAPLSPAETLGLNGFDVAYSNTFAFLSARGNSIKDPAPWERVHADADPTHVLWRPGITVRKGLPLSLEVGGTWSWLAFSRQTALAGFARWSVFEGWENAPDVSMQLGYSGYVGNEELELGAFDGSLNFGYTFPLGYIIGINQADIAPFAGVGFMKANAAPRLSVSQQKDIGIGPVSGMKSKDSFVEGFSLVTTHLGLRIRSGDFHLSTSGSIVPKALATINMAVGLTY